MKKLTYDDLKPENYLNSTPVGTLAGQDIVLQDIVTAGLFGKLNFICKGQKSAGKTQLMRDIYTNYFGGEDHSLWEMGRADFKPRELFEKLNISAAKGQAIVPQIRQAYNPSEKGMEYFIQTHSGNGEFSWTQIQKEEAESIMASAAITSDNLVQLKNTDKHFFCIDEYNRCPEVIMNLFYGMMTGEINHQGRVVGLGDGYYSGMAAINPEDYSGTFKMDLAMMARFHIAIDFDAYRLSIEDKDELICRNLSPDVHQSEPRDLLPQIHAVYTKIKQKEPTLKERQILQYFQTGLDTCTELSKSKELIIWPRECTTQACSKQTNLCGRLKCLDARAIRAVYRLSKGLEEVARIKAGNEDLKIDSLDSMILAYKFVAPYKGCVSPQATKDVNGIEALVVAESADSMMSELKTKLEDFDKLVRKSKASSIKGGSLASLRQQFKEDNMEAEYQRIESETRAKYAEERELTFDELKQKSPETVDELLKEILSNQILENPMKYERPFMSTLQKSQRQAFLDVAKLKTGITKEEYDSMKNQGQKKSLQEVNATLRQQYDQTVHNAITSLAKSSQTDSLIETFEITQDQVDEAEEAIKQRTKRKIQFMPKSKKPLFEKELRDKLTARISEISSQKFQNEKDTLFQGECDFLVHFYEKSLEEED